jgi:hypothetical protein
MLATAEPQDDESEGQGDHDVDRRLNRGAHEAHLARPNSRLDQLERDEGHDERDRGGPQPHGRLKHADDGGDALGVTIADGRPWRRRPPPA